MITLTKIGVTITLAFGITTYSLHAACNAPNNQGQYTITITGGSASVQDGESSTYTCTMTPSVSGVTPTWSLDPVGGGGNGLTKPVITPSGNSATVTFYWHAGGGDVSPCTYTLKCKTSADCEATKSITVTVQNPMGMCHGGSVGVIVYDYYGTDTNRVKYLEYTTSYASSDINGHSNSQFRQKTIVHEQSHETDFTGGSSSPLGAEGNIVGLKWLKDNNYWYAMVSDSSLAQIENDAEAYVDNELIGPLGNWTSWTEVRAYTADRVENPHHFEH